MPRIHHPITKATTEVPEAVVKHWTERAGWQLVELEPRPRTVLVLARTKADADRYVKEADLSGQPAVYAGSADAVAGLSAADVDVVEIPGFTEHRYAQAIADALAAVGIRTTPTNTGGDEDDPSTDSSTTEHEE